MTNQRLPVKIGLLGAGFRLRYVAKNLLAESAGQIEIGAIYDPDPIAQKATVAEFGAAVVVCSSEEELLARADLSWIFIGTFNYQHAEQAIRAMQAGKDVFCEKPLATELDDCLKIRETIRQTGRTFSFGLVLRYSPLYRKVKELVADGTIGELISFEFNETLSFNHAGYIFGNWRRHRALAGPHLLEKCCHDLDLANWITGRLPMKAASFGSRNFFTPENERHVARIGPNKEGKPAYQTWDDPRKVNPFTADADIVDNQVAIIEYTGGVRATFHTNCNAGIPERRFYLCGTEGSLRANACTGVIEYSRIAHEPHTVHINTDAAGGHAGGDSVMARSLLKTITEGAVPLAGVEDGLRACVVAFGIDASMREGTITDFRSYWEAVGEKLPT